MNIYIYIYTGRLHNSDLTCHDPLPFPGCFVEQRLLLWLVVPLQALVLIPASGQACTHMCNGLFILVGDS